MGVIVPENSTSDYTIKVGDVAMVKSPSKAPAKRGRTTERIYIAGTNGLWQIDADGNLYYRRTKATPDGNQPKIDLGPNAYPPVIPAYDDGTRHRFVDELVCWHFNERLSLHRQKHARMIHLDGDWRNCAADNVHQVIDPEYLYQQDVHAWMASGIPPAGKSMGWIKGVSGVYSFAPYHGELTPRDLRDDLHGDDADSAVSLLAEYHELPITAWVNDRRKAEYENRKAS